MTKPEAQTLLIEQLCHFICPEIYLGIGHWDNFMNCGAKYCIPPVLAISVTLRLRVLDLTSKDFFCTWIHLTHEKT